MKKIKLRIQWISVIKLFIDYKKIFTKINEKHLSRRNIKRNNVTVDSVKVSLIKNGSSNPLKNEYEPLSRYKALQLLEIF